MLNKTYVIRTIRILISFSTVIILFYLFLPTRENIIDTMNATVGKGHVDILCIGSSHMQYGLNPIQMYDDKGYATYTIAVGSQAPWQSYYYIKEACKDQSPSLIILDVYKASVSQDDSGYTDADTVNNLLDTPLSISKIKALIISNANSRLDILLRFPYIHDEYSSVKGFKVHKFFGKKDYSLGYVYSDEVEVNPDDVINKSSVTDVSAISKKNEKYLRMIIEYCRDNSINLLLVNAPCPTTGEKGQMHSNYISILANEYGVPYIDGNKYWTDIGLDWTTDRADTHGHLNHSGVTKFTTYVEKYVQDNYNIPDRRGLNEYYSYEKAVENAFNEIYS